jgi:hypothetical protein
MFYCTNSVSRSRPAVNLANGAISGIESAPLCKGKCPILMMVTLQTGYNRFTVAFQSQFFTAACAILKKQLKATDRPMNCPKTVTSWCTVNDKKPKTNHKLLTFIPACFNVKAAEKESFCC